MIAHTAFAVKAFGMWRLYSSFVENGCTVTLEGTPCNPAYHTIEIKPGWNWVGFPSAEPLDIAEAMAGFEAEEGDLIVADYGATEFDGEEWFGDMETFEIGQGFFYFSSSSEVKDLVFQTGLKK